MKGLLKEVRVFHEIVGKTWQKKKWQLKETNQLGQTLCQLLFLFSNANRAVTNLHDVSRLRGIDGSYRLTLGSLRLRSEKRREEGNWTENCSVISGALWNWQHVRQETFWLAFLFFSLSFFLFFFLLLQVWQNVRCISPEGSVKVSPLLAFRFMGGHAFVCAAWRMKKMRGDTGGQTGGQRW